MVLLTGIYAWATVAFGLRFSNLTYRGVLTNGPYAFTRHPAYLSKNAFWWMSNPAGGSPPRIRWLMRSATR
jgi:protein-S-isoprenylcysteine O-methyltransferase Ste14